MTLDAPNFVFPDSWYKNKAYAKSREQRRKKWDMQLEEQMKRIVETYGYDEHGNLVPKEELEKTHRPVGEVENDASENADSSDKTEQPVDSTSDKTEL